MTNNIASVEGFHVEYQDEDGRRYQQDTQLTYKIMENALEDDPFEE